MYVAWRVLLQWNCKRREQNLVEGIVDYYSWHALVKLWFRMGWFWSFGAKRIVFWFMSVWVGVQTIRFPCWYRSPNTAMSCGKGWQFVWAFLLTSTFSPTLVYLLSISSSFFSSSDLFCFCSLLLQLLICLYPRTDSSDPLSLTALALHPRLKQSIYSLI